MPKSYISIVQGKKAVEPLNKLNLLIKNDVVTHFSLPIVGETSNESEWLKTSQSSDDVAQCVICNKQFYTSGKTKATWKLKVRYGQYSLNTCSHARIQCHIFPERFLNWASLGKHGRK